MKKNLPLAVAFIIISANIQAKIWRVNNTTGANANFKTAQAAADSAANGDTIYLEASAVTYGPLHLWKKAVVIGNGYFLGENTGLQNNLSSSIIDYLVFGKEVGNATYPASNSSGSQVIGLDIISQYLGGVGVNIFTPNNLIKRCKTTSAIYFGYDAGNSNAYKSGIHFTPDPTNTIISQCYINSILIYGGCNALISNSIINGTVTNYATSSGVIVSNNTLTLDGMGLDLFNANISNNILIGTTSILKENSNYNNNIAVNAILPAGNSNQNSISLSSIIVNTGSSDGKYKLTSSSVAKSAGYGGTDCGAYGGSTPYVLSGIPGIPSIYSLITNALNTNSMPVTISVKSNK